MVKQRGFVIWAVLLAGLLGLLNLPLPASRQAKEAVREALAPLHALVSGAGLRLREAGTTLRGIGGLASENRALQEEVLRLRGEMRALQTDAKENGVLRELLGFKRRAGQKLVAAEVIARDSTGWWQTLRLDRGSRDGLAADLAVVTPDGLAGRIVEVSDHTADVLLVSDPSCRVAVRIPRTGSNGVLSGTGVRWNGQVVCRIDFINRNHAIRPGDEVVTSGLGGVFPPDLPVGYVETVETDAAGLYLRAEVLPRADLARMRHAFVLAAPREAPAPSRRGAAP
ncbi:MAG: rod shape-determining protein MreC [Lentisphaerae bacterium]|nr:rod shape-determining protein MreC [Lentisphaerota bacterium]